MCGIAGFSWNDGSLVRRMAETLKHRGPDQSGHFADASVSLGHSRLSIIDLSDKGRQPMSNEDGTLWMVCNGEIYNHRELRRELEGRHRFASGTDTEVILHAYEEWGTDAFRRFNGMWAFALYDRKAGTLVLCRDRAGKKPLYYARTGDGIVFASELKAIVLHHPVERKVSKEATDLYFSLGYIPSPWSVFEGIAKVEPRQFLLYDLRGRDLKPGRYYEIPDYAPVRDHVRLIREGTDLLADAVRLRLAADVPVGAFLSGGLDSSSVVAAMAKGTDPSRLHTFSIGFEGPYDETPFMEIVKAAFKTNHHHRYFTREDLERDFDVLPFYFDEPFGDPASLPTFDVCRMAARRVTVCLSGDGGDEVFGGYRMHRRAARHAALRKVPAFVREGIRKALRHARPGTPPGKLREVLRLSLLPAEEFYAEADGGPTYKPAIYRKWSALMMREMLEKAGGNLVQAVIAYDLFVHALPDLFLVKTDRASMANALEVRCPFLDHRFIEFAAGVPVRWKTTRKRSKILLRRIARGLVPDEIARRWKKGFTPPILEWILDEPYAAMAREAVEALREKGVLDDAWLDYYAGTALNGKDGLARMMRWRILVFRQWWKTWMDGRAERPAQPVPAGSDRESRV